MGARTAVVLFAATTLFARSAAADEPRPVAPMFAPLVAPTPDGEPLPLSTVDEAPRHSSLSAHAFLTAMGGYGLSGATVSGRVGVALSNHLTLALDLSYDSGAIATTTLPTYSDLYGGPEVGGDITLGSVVIRPYIGAGIWTTTSVRESAPTASSSMTVSWELPPARTLPAAWVGAQALFDVPRTRLFLVADVRAIAPTDVSLFAGLGLKLGS